MKDVLRPAFALFLLLSLITGVAYPAAITGLAQILFPSQANGSLLRVDGKAVGSALIGQEHGSDAKLFWGRLSATGPVPFSAFNAGRSAGSSGSNLGPTNPVLLENVKARIAALRAADHAAGYERPAGQPVPVDLVTASGSGLDPHISLAAADYQVGRVARARGLTEATVRELVARHTSSRQLGILGEPVVHVLALNLALP
jgi:K+-transporting ATPase ATPase C chain